MPLLDDIAVEIRADVERARREHPLDTMHIGRRAHNLAAALRRPGPRVIAEVKRASPSAGRIAPDADVPATASAFTVAGAAAVSIITESRHFNGSRASLMAVRRRCPDALVLMKDFVVDPYQVDCAYVDGADSVLLIMALLGAERLRELHAHARELGMSCLVEVHDEAEMALAADVPAEIIGVNNRDLRTMEVSLDTSRRLVSLAPPGTVLVSESGIQTGAEVAELRRLGFHGCLVGTSLMRSKDPAAALVELLAAAG